MVFLELRRDSRVTTGNSGCLLCWPRQVQSSYSFYFSNRVFSIENELFPDFFCFSSFDFGFTNENGDFVHDVFVVSAPYAFVVLLVYPR